MLHRLEYIIKTLCSVGIPGKTKEPNQVPIMCPLSILPHVK